MGFKVRFTQGAGVAGTLSQAGESGGIPGNIHLPGDSAGVYEARRQWLSGRAEDEWATANEWLVETGPDGRFELLGLPSGRTTLRFDGIGVTPLEQTVILEGGGIRHIPVFNGSNLVGIVSERDVREARIRLGNANKVSLDEICTRDVATVSPVATASDAVKTMLDRRIGSVVVVDGGFVVGIFTTTDALRVVNDYFR